MQDGNVNRILIVDDHDLVRGFTRTALEQVGYFVDTAENGREALEMIRDGGKYELLITDINMPIFDGLELLDALRDNSSMRKVIYSATAEERDIRQALTEMNLADQIEAIIGKPCPVTDFLTTIEMVLHKPT